MTAVALPVSTAELLLRALETDAERGETLLRAEDRARLLGELRAALTPCAVCQGTGHQPTDPGYLVPCPACDLPSSLAQHTRRMRSAFAHDRVALALLERCGLRIAQLEAERNPSDVQRDRDEVLALAKSGQLA
ncbi:hypothetical protein [Deinococcus radiotolerans]|uniref:Uncharacterized protein n=1 Tax=Deinococcus radiotolerans TaxID=1309407 RepID=A0ABQ2FQ37_9DEIO|nr:hypothetical protein [Deinococcus radiotolerans]GGL15612.1 hypothetical protein GCM10010844_38170 [Deinococcus radiotolerans]